MTPEAIVTFGKNAMWITIMISSPLLLSALAIGLVIGIFQAATQINEMTLSFIPKLLALLVALLVAGPWIMATMVNYTRRTIEEIPMLIG